MPLKILPLGIAGIISAASIPDANIVLNALMLVILLFGAPRFFKSKQAQAALEEKDRTIATHEQTIAAIDRAIKEVRDERDSWRERYGKLQVAAEGFQARYEEAQKYTAKEALQVLQQMLQRQEMESERRHLELMAALQSGE